MKEAIGSLRNGRAKPKKSREVGKIPRKTREPCAAVTVAEQNRQEVADIITQTIAGWDPDATVDRIELAVGRDLQFVRINGTLVGGFVGLAIYTVYRALH